ncbi:PriCT-2 domain-containing protein, partial [Turicimonas muris]
MIGTITFGQAAQKLVDNGYLPIPVIKGEKRPALSEWQRYRFKPADAVKYADYGVGLLTGQSASPVGLIDVDTRDQQLAYAIEQEVAKFNVITRVGEDPKAGYFILLPKEGFPKITSAMFDDGRYSELPEEEQKKHKDQFHRLEILGYGQQFVAYGIHPKTGAPYEYTTPWEAEPLNTPATSLNRVREDQLKALIKKFEDLCRAKGWKIAEKGSSGRKTQGTTEPLTAFDVECMRCKDIPLSKARELLAYIDNDDYDTWREVGMALHLEYAGSDEALALWDEWSFNSAKYPEGGLDALKKKWDSFEEIGKLRTELVRMPSIIAKAEEGRLSIEIQMRAAAKVKFIADLEKCSSEYEVEALVRKTSAPGRADREIYTDHVAKRLKALGVKAITKATINDWYKRSSYTGYPLNELGLAMRMMDKYKGGLLWDCVNGVPYAWTGFYWKKIYHENLMCCARNTVEEFGKSIPEMKDGSEKDELKAFVQQSSRPFVWENMIKAFKSFAEGDVSVIVHPSDFNKHLRYFGVANGEIDLDTCTFIKSDPSHLLTLHSPVKYDPEADCPYTKKKILEMCSNDRELADYVWTLFALAMTGKIKRTFPIFYGKGHNGKSALISIFRRVFGIGDEGYFITADPKTFLEGYQGSAGSAREDITRLKDKRLVALIESKEGA